MAANILQRMETSLRSFYIFNSSYCNKEGEEYKKVLYYYPDDIELNTKIKDVGLSEAIIAFTSTFTDSDNDCKALHTQKTTQLFYQAEPGYWLVLVVNVPKEIRTKNGVEVTDYRGNEVHDDIYSNVLKQCFNMFRLLEGTFQIQISKALTIHNNDAEEARKFLIHNMKQFFDQHLSTLKVPVNDVIGLTHSMHYLPLDKLLFLRAHNLTNTICATFPNIKDVIFLYKENIVCSGKIHPQDLFCLHEYIMDLLNENDAQQGSSTSISTYAETNINGAFLLGGDNARPTPLIYLQSEYGKLLSYQLAVYRALNATLCLQIENNVEQTNAQSKEFYEEFHISVGVHLHNLSSDISDMLNQKYSANIKTNKSLLSTSTSNNAVLQDALLSDANALTTPKYIFINEQSLKHLSNIRRLTNANKTITASLPSNILNLMADLIGASKIQTLGSEKSQMASATEEVQIKTTNDFWIVRRCCNWRQYYVIIFNSKATLLDITQEAKRIFEQELKDVVFFND